MSKINIVGIDDNNDISYRYKMNKLNVVKRKNTVIVDNIKVVCEDIERDPKLLVDFFKKKFSISFVYKDNILSTTGNLSYNDFFNALREFIQHFVLCGTCHLPETEISIGKHVELACKACSKKTVKNINGATRYEKHIEKFISGLVK